MNHQPSTPASLNEAVAEIVTFGGLDGQKEVSWRKGQMPPVGTKLYAAPGAAIDAREQEIVAPGWNEAVEAAAKVLDNGSFLHKDSPVKKWAVQAAEAVRKLVVPLSAAPYISPREKRLREAVAKMHQWRDEKSAAAAASGKPTLQMLHEMAYLLKLVPRGSSVPVQILDVLSKQFEAAMAALASRQEAPVASAQAPFAYYVYIPAEQRGELVHNLDEATDDLTNCECEVTKLYATPSEALSPATVAQPVDMAQRWNAVVQLAHELDDAAQHITERQAYDFATQFRVLAGVDGCEAANQAAQPLASQGCGGAVVLALAASPSCGQGVSDEC